MANNLRKFIKNFERNPTVGSKVVDLLSRYLGRGGGSALMVVDIVEYRCKATPRRTAYGNSSKQLSAIQRSDLKL